MSAEYVWSWIALWFPIWAAVWIVAHLGTRLFLKKRSTRKPSEPVESEDEWATWKKLAAEIRSRKTKELAEWQKEFLELLQRNCKNHKYDGTKWRDWYKCTECEFEQPWRHHSNCSCRTQEDYSLTEYSPNRVLLVRSTGCEIHGRTPARERALERGRWAAGGYDGTRDETMRDVMEAGFVLDRKVKYLEETYGLPSTKDKR